VIYTLFGLWWFLTYLGLKAGYMAPQEAHGQLEKVPKEKNILYLISAPLVPILVPIAGICLICRRLFT
jgi:hypothetical protein